MAVQGDAVAVAFPFGDGISAVWLPPLELLLLLLLLLELLELDSVHGGTISVVMLLFDGTTSWFWGVCPELACAAGPPPGVTRIVLDGGGEGGGALLLLELLELLELDELIGAMHGWIATVSVNEPGGITISLEPGGTTPPPDCTTVASEQGGTAILSAVFCLGTWTVRIPGSINAVDTASELDELLLLLPPRLQPLSPREAAAMAPIAHLPAQRSITISVSSRLDLPARRRLAAIYPIRRRSAWAGLRTTGSPRRRPPRARPAPNAAARTTLPAPAPRR